jgi:hypothetical protein
MLRLRMPSSNNVETMFVQQDQEESVIASVLGGLMRRESHQTSGSSRMSFVLWRKKRGEET